MIFGDVQLGQSSQSHIEVAIERVYVHPMFNTISFWNDLAVLKLATPVTFTDDVRPLCLESRQNETGYSTCYTAGWDMLSSMSGMCREQSFNFLSSGNKTLQDVSFRINCIAQGIMDRDKNMHNSA